MSAKTMKVGVVTAPGTFEVQDRPLPVAAPDGWVLIEICAVGVCGTDYHILEGKHPFLAYPRIIGHELSGRVLQDGNGWAEGDLVVVNPYLSCGTCRACIRGKPNCCYNIQVLGVHRDGGLARRLAVPAENLYPADGLSPQQAAMVEFLAIGAHAVRRSEVAARDRVLVTGVGPIGIGAALFARLTGAEVSLLDHSPDRLRMAQDRFGFASGHLSVDAAIAATHGEGYDVVFDATGHGGAIEAGFAAVAHGGSYTLVSVVKDDITFHDPDFHKRELRLIGSRNALRADFDWVIAAFGAGDIDAAALCSSQVSLDAFAATFGELAADRSSLIKVIVQMQS
ncbi:zinc-binding alcohol dehydrogenase family protein [Tropicimonas sp. IMCC34043]|uniref:zinc-binding alcohol dehydrogenase family protein n=1 Tax=Tropicimonas sp. IMCC34043 TaxID=2248760 RepID=UPI0018E4E5E6|nr:zinc-binding alcohol dehydrogenase family protein [Tropicimonas sp. IMCC34043]